MKGWLQWLLIFALWLGGTVCPAQRILWEKRIGWEGADVLNAVESISNGNFIAAGFSQHYGTLIPDRFGALIPYYGITLLAISQAGDTLWTQALGYYTQYNTAMCKGPGRSLLLAAKTALTSSELRIFRLDYEGNLLSSFSLSGSAEYYPASMRLMPDSSVVLTGLMYPDSNSSRTEMFVVSVLEPFFGLLNYRRTYTDHPSLNIGTYAEPTPDGKLLVSSIAGSRLVAWVLDDTGGVLNKQTVYQSANGNILEGAAAIQAAPDMRYIYSATVASRTRPTFYLGSHQGLGGAKLWGGEQVGETIAPYVNDDGSMVFYYGTPTNLYLSKIAADSTPIWQVSIYNRLAPGCFPKALSYLADSSAVLVGYTNDNNSPLGQDFYLARISGVGVPYNPAHPVATRPQASQLQPRPYPNPATGTLRFSGLTTPAHLALYGIDGKQQLAQSLAPGQALNISLLPKGLYLYRLTTQSKTWQGRLVKE